MVRCFLLSAFLVLLVACGGGGEGGGSSSGGQAGAQPDPCEPAASPAFALSTYCVNLTGSTSPAGASIQRVYFTPKVSGIATILIQPAPGYTTSSSWVVSYIDLSQGYADVTASAVGLSEGVYRTVVRVTAFSGTGASLGYQDVLVTLTVSHPVGVAVTCGPYVSTFATLSQACIQFDAVAGQLSPRQSLYVSNVSSAVGGISLGIDSSDSWIKQAWSADRKTIEIWVDASALAPGTYSRNLYFRINDQHGMPLAYKELQLDATVEASSGSSGAAGIAWNLVDGNVKPGTAGSLQRAGGTPEVFNVVGPGGAFTFVDAFSANGDGTVRFDSTADITHLSLARALTATGNAGIYPKYVTFLMRVSPVTGVTYNSATRLMDFELALSDIGIAGGRVQGRFVAHGSSPGVQLFDVEDGVESSLRGVVADGSIPHIYHVAVALSSPLGGTITVFADGNDTPIIGPYAVSNMRRALGTGQNFVEIGEKTDTGSNKSDIDWLIWTSAGAYTPSQLQGKLPSGIGITAGY